MSEIGICKFCGEKKKLCKSHIVPKSFYIKETHKIIVDNLHYEPNLHAGFYDENILCSDCDAKFGQYENHAKQILFDKTETYRHQHIDAYTIPSSFFDYYKFRMFIVFLAWKTSISNADYCNQVNLGPYESKALEILKETNNYNQYFGFTIFKNSNNLFKGLHIKPYKVKYYKTISYNFVFSGYNITVIPNFQEFMKNLKNDKSPLRIAVAEPNKDISILMTDDKKLTGLEHAKDIFDAHMKMKNTKE